MIQILLAERYSTLARLKLFTIPDLEAEFSGLEADTLRKSLVWTLVLQTEVKRLIHKFRKIKA